MMQKSIAVLFARADSIYKQIEFCDVYDIERDARTYTGNLPVVAHPPCRAWGRLRHFANPRHDEKELAFFAVEMVRKFGGVLEHPESSTLWMEAQLPHPALGNYDAFGGFTLALPQKWFGHRAEKKTWLYISGCKRKCIPTLPLSLGDAECVVETKKKDNPRPSVSRKQREATPRDFALWLCELAKIAGKGGMA